MKIAKRYLALVLSFALFFALPLAFTQEASAASKGTKILQPSLKIMSSSHEGESSTAVTAYAYNNKGLMSAEVYQDGTQEAYAYNKNGYMTMRAYLDKKGVPQSQIVYNVKKGKVQNVADYDLDDGKVTLTGYSTFSYKSGKISKLVYTSADGTRTEVATFKNGKPSQYVTTVVNEYVNSQYVSIYDKYGNVTSETTVNKFADGDTTTATKVYKNSYKKDKLVKTVWTRAYKASASSDARVTNGLDVYTYKKGKLVKADSAYSFQSDPSVTYGTTHTYAYGKGGLITSESTAAVRVTPTESKVTGAYTTAYQYKKVAVDKKCVNAVNEAMKSYSFESYIPGNSASFMD